MLAREPIKLLTDHGKEFVSKLFDQMLKGRRIIQIHTHQDVKAQIVERFNCTFKGLLFKYMTHHKTYRYIHLLQDFVDSYNSRPHCGIGGCAPNDINKSNKHKIFELQYGEYLRSIPRKHKFSVNDKVRLSAYRYAFKRGFHKNYTEWIFMVIDRLNTNPPT